jgi:hypothetical protein
MGIVAVGAAHLTPAKPHNTSYPVREVKRSKAGDVANWLIALARQTSLSGGARLFCQC